MSQQENLENSTESVSISVSRGMREQLWDLKKHHTESYEKLIARLIEDSWQLRQQLTQPDNLNNIR